MEVKFVYEHLFVEFANEVTEDGIANGWNTQLRETYC